MGDSEKLTVGWREWLALPLLDLPAIKAKVDTGARTSAIHAFDIEVQSSAAGDWIEFCVHPLQRNSTLVRRCRARLVDERRVTDSGGHAENRYVITTDIVLGTIRRNIEVTLTERDNMLFRMLLGRTAMIRKVIVDPSRSYVCGRLAARKLYR